MRTGWGPMSPISSAPIPPSHSINFDLTGALNEMTEIIRRYHIVLPSQAAMLIKVLVTLEGTTRMLSPSFSVMEVMQPFHRKMLLQRLSPMRQWRKLRRTAIGSGTADRSPAASHDRYPRAGSDRDLRRPSGSSWTGPLGQSFGSGDVGQCACFSVRRCCSAARSPPCSSRNRPFSACIDCRFSVSPAASWRCCSDCACCARSANRATWIAGIEREVHVPWGCPGGGKSHSHAPPSGGQWPQLIRAPECLDWLTWRA